MEWLPIETAPKDQAILGYMPNDRPGCKPYMAVIYWDDQFQVDGWDDEADDVAFKAAWCAGRVGSFSYEEYAEEKPTHWAPLPEPPK